MDRRSFIRGVFSASVLPAAILAKAMPAPSPKGYLTVNQVREMQRIADDESILDGYMEAEIVAARVRVANFSELRRKNNIIDLPKVSG